MSFFILIVLLLNKRKKYITEQRNLDLNYVVLIIFIYHYTNCTIYNLTKIINNICILRKL